MPKRDDGVPSHYPCLTQKDRLRRVHHPHDERIVPRQTRLRQALGRLLAALRA